MFPHPPASSAVPNPAAQTVPADRGLPFPAGQGLGGGTEDLPDQDRPGQQPRPMRRTILSIPSNF